jgi:hypothetical protein
MLMASAAEKLLELHPLLLQEAILRRAVTGISLEDSLTMLETVWTSRTTRQPENEELLTEATVRGANKAREALENDRLISPPSRDEVGHLMESEVREVRLVGILLLSSVGTD